ncbi:aldehyde dehydrogenase family protein [Alphaproteobacteria bacterium]|nr:aldehyde dehydrogenase family protein [Alphaproteobacteria bacterium]
MDILSKFENIDYGPAMEDIKVANQWLDSHNRKLKLFINGQFAEPSNNKYFDTINPATGEIISKISYGEEKDIYSAVASAQNALHEWKNYDSYKKSSIIYALARLIQRNARLLAVLETLDNGKPIRETRDIDIPLVARHFYHHAGWPQLLEKEFPDYESVGVVGQIIPWNFPLLMLAWKIAPALASGCTIILKPAEYTSITAIFFAELCVKAGVPPGVINIVTGDGKTGELLVQNKNVNKIAFTGSTEVGKKIRAETSGSEKKLTLELGGKSPFIIFEDADIDSAVEGVVDGIWFNQGEVCCAGSRLLLQESIADKVISKIKLRMNNLRVGNPLDKSIDIGAIVAPTQLNRIKDLVNKGIEAGANIWQSNNYNFKDGNFYPPTLVTNVGPSSLLSQVEIFGPVIVSMNFRTPSDAVALANNTKYGLAASIWSENINLALDIAPQIKAGVVWINSTNLFDASSGFGGYRESGFGREGGVEGLISYLKPKYLKSLNNHVEKINEIDSKENLYSRNILPTLDRTSKQYINGIQKRPDSGYSRPVINYLGKHIGDVSEGNRKDIRDAVEAASKCDSWNKLNSHNKAQILYYIAENLQVRSKEFIDRIILMTGKSREDSELEFNVSIKRIFYYAAWTDKFDGNIHSTPYRNVTIAMNEAIGVIGIISPNNFPLLGLVSLLMPALSLGNRVIIVPSSIYPLSAVDFYQVLDTSDVVPGSINIVTGDSDLLAKTLAEHNSVDSIWYFGNKSGSKMIEAASICNMKQTWVNNGKNYDWLNSKYSEGKEFLSKASQVKNIWIPYGE